jgi:hypothetical protein
MSYRDPRTLKWELRLKHVFDHIDHELEDQYGPLFRLPPNRPPRGTTANPESDGFLNLGAAFTAGYGSASGAGYVVEIRLAALGRIPEDVLREIEQTVEQRLRDLLPTAFPERKLAVSREGHTLKVIGDLSL